MRKSIEKSVSVLMIVIMTLSTLFGCSLEASAVRSATQEEKASRVASMIDIQLASVMSSSVAEQLDEEGLAELMEIREASRGVDGRGIVSRMLEEDNGRQMLDFTYSAMTSDDLDAIIEEARPLVPDEGYAEIVRAAEDLEARSIQFYNEESRAMNSQQQKKFYEALRSLVVKATVLLTAAVVYAYMPKTLVWGKVSACCVAAICAGITASGFMTVVGYSRYGGEDFNFINWLNDVWEDTYAQWAIAASTITTASAAGKSPVVTAIILAALAAYQVFDEAKEMYRIATK